MATKTINITSYSSLTLTYSIAQTDKTTTVTFTNWSFKNTRSSGLAYACALRVGFISSASSQGAQMRASEITLASSLPVGTKTKSGTFSSAWATYTKLYSAESEDISCSAELESASDYWSNNAHVTFTVPAMRSYKVTLNANGGTGGTASLTKWHDVPLSLTDGFTAPAREGWKFLGWNTDSTATAAQSSYTANAATTLYAVWARHITGIALSVSTLRVTDGTATAESDEGEWCYGTCDYTVTGAAAGNLSLTVSVSPSGPAIQTSSFAITKQADQTLTGTIVFRASGCSTESDYTFTVNASCSNTSTTQTAVVKSLADVLTAAYFPFDILGDAYWDYENQTGERPAHGVAFGEPAKWEGFRVAMKPYFGSFPKKDTADEYALIVGNGDSDSARSNALAVKKDGHLIFYTDSSGSTANDLLTPASGITINWVSWSRWGNVASIRASWSRAGDIVVPANGDLTNITIGTINDGFRPATDVAAMSRGDGGLASYLISAGGNIQLCAMNGTGSARSITEGTNLFLYSTYVLAK